MTDEIQKPKHPGGRPPKYKTPEELQAKVDEYFETHKESTTSGLALFLGYADWRALYDLGKLDKFSDIISIAKLRIAERYEMLLERKN
jgi:hypothetical protein